MSYPDKDILELLEEFEETGGCTHICPDCGEETNRTEIDSNSAFCENCDELKYYEPVI